MSEQSQGVAVLHVGAPKTGSTYLQSVLWRNHDALFATGVHVLGEDQGQHHRASHDLRGARFDPADPGVDWTGAWDRMASRAADSPAPTVVVTEEKLAALTAGQVQRAVTSLAPRVVHVVYVTRDLPGLLPSEWQEYVKHGTRAPYSEWAAEVLESREDGPGRWFWQVHDLESVVQRWATAVPQSNIHVITMPSSAAPRDELWRRFCLVLGCPPDVATDVDVQANPSLGLAGAEVLRRVNAALPPDLPQWHRIGVVRDVLANEVLNPLSPPGRPALPQRLVDEVVARATRTQALLDDLGCDVIGDAEEIAPAPQRLQGAEAPDQNDVADLAIGALAEMAVRLARARDELRDERLDRRRADDRLIAEHEQSLAAQEAAFWAQHPWAHRTQRLKERTVAAEENSRLVATGMSAYRALRRRHGSGPDTGQ